MADEVMFLRRFGVDSAAHIWYMRPFWMQA